MYMCVYVYVCVDAKSVAHVEAHDNPKRCFSGAILFIYSFWSPQKNRSKCWVEHDEDGENPLPRFEATSFLTYQCYLLQSVLKLSPSNVKSKILMQM